MRILNRFILGLLVVVQSLPGLAAMPCAPMAGGDFDVRLTASARPTVCLCCAGGDESTGAACSTGGSAAVCQCGEPRRDGPQAPPVDSKSQPLHEALATLTALIGCHPPEPMPAMAKGAGAEGLPHRPANSIQSLLCVWVV